MNDLRGDRVRGLCPGRALLDEARRRRSAVAALNFYNAETLIAHARAARARRVPLFLQTTEATIDYLGLGMAVAMARATSEELELPVTLHLDHGQSYEIAARAIDAGYSSVMIDGSMLSFDENVALTRRVVEQARGSGVSVEGEIGHVGMTENAEVQSLYTRPEDARRFVELTGVDSLAVAIGTQHGFYRGEVALDFDRLSAIHQALPAVPLVLHGGSGVSRDLLLRAIELGVVKVNFGTEIKNAFMGAARDALTSSADIDLRRSFAPAIRAVSEMSAIKLDICWGTEWETR
jgi:ketose-bisphosphate aldolase